MYISQEDKKKKSIIYKITNKINGKIYIVQSRNTFLYRYKCNKISPRDGRIIYNAFISYGSDAFIVEILEHNIPIEKLNEREIYYIAYFNSISPNGYNLTFGGDSKNNISNETRQKMKISARKRSDGNYLLIKGNKEYYFNNIAKFVEEQGLPPRSTSHISAVIRSLRKSAYGFYKPGTDMENIKVKDAGKIKKVKKDGIIYEFKNIKKFTIQHGLSYSHFMCLLQERVIQYNGYTLLNPREYRYKRNTAKYKAGYFLKDKTVRFLSF
jgi:group I intron endonuclease